MRMRFLLIFSVFILPLLSHGQTDHYTQSGYTSFIIKFSGKYPKDKPISTPMLSNPLLTEKPTDFHAINDSTLFMSYYTFGPTLFYFFYNQDYCKPLLLPNHSDVLNIHYIDSTQYSMRYEGTFKEVFDYSKEYGEMIREALFTGPYFPRPKPGTYQTANEYRDDVIKENERMINALTKDISSEFIKKLFRYQMESTAKKWYLFDDYNLRASNEVKIDSGTIKVPLKRDISFYKGMDLLDLGDTDKLISSHNDLFRTLRQDSILNLPNILTTNPDTYLNKLKEIFDSEINNSNNHFYEIMIAGAYMDQINLGSVLTEKQKLDVIKFFQNKQISNYIIHHNELISKNAQQSLTKYYLHYDKEQESVLDDILLRYKGKVLVIDFWATWCGPCIEASGKIKKVKEQFAKDDVVFVYLTDESSDPTKWKEFVEYLGGEHYYLYNHQSDKISDEFSIETIPSYLIFGKDGKLREKNLGGYMGNEKLTRWIKTTLKD